MSDPDFKIHPPRLLDVTLSHFPGLALELHVAEWTDHIAGEVRVAGGDTCVAVVIRANNETRFTARRPMGRIEEGLLVAAVTDVFDEIARDRIRARLLASVAPPVVVLPRGKFTLVLPFPVSHGAEEEWHRLEGAFVTHLTARERTGGAVAVTSDTIEVCAAPSPPRPVKEPRPLFVRSRVVLDLRDRILVALRGEFRTTTEGDYVDGELVDLVTAFTATHDLSPLARRVLVALRLAKPPPEHGTASPSDGAPPEKTS